MSSRLSAIRRQDVQYRYRCSIHISNIGSNVYPDHQSASSRFRVKPVEPQASDEPEVQFTLYDIVCVKLGFDSKVLLAQVSPSLHYQVALLPLVLPFFTKRHFILFWKYLYDLLHFNCLFSSFWINSVYYTQQCHYSRNVKLIKSKQKGKFKNENKKILGWGGRIAQWIAFSLRTQRPRIRFLAFPRFFQIPNFQTSGLKFLDVVEIYRQQCMLSVCGQCIKCLIVDRTHLYKLVAS